MGVPIIFKGPNAKMLNSKALEFKDNTTVNTNNGTPEGAVIANPGSCCRDIANGDFYIKNTGTGNTGWLQISTLADAAVATEDTFVPTLAQTVFGLSGTPGSDAAFAWYLNGQLRLRGIDYTQVGTVVTWLDPGGLTLKITDEMIARYNVIGGAAGQPGVTESNFVFAFDTTTQTISLSNTFQDVDFAANGQLNGWTHTPGTAIFTCNQTGKYMSNYGVATNKTGGAAATFELISTFNGLELVGGQVAKDVTTNNSVRHISANCIFDAVAGQDYTVQMASSSTNLQITPLAGTATTDVSASLTLTRIA